MKTPAEQQLLLWDHLRPYRPPARQPRLRQWNTVEQVAEYFQVSNQTVRNWIDEGALTAMKKGQALRIAKQSIRLFIAHHKSTKDTPDQFLARRSAIAEIQAVVRQHLSAHVPDARERKRLAAKIWRDAAPVIRGHRDDL
ncbi:MAG: helix-turn-helix domain-containing protein [Deltaproteobacteria bacterium]|nr:helix-turn-helix domain-containing protein [Deltaproteobacteria bacterium]